MKVVSINKNMIGKLVYFLNPIFKLNDLLDSLNEFTQNLEKITSLKLSSPIIEPIDPTKVLGKNQNTIKYDYAGFLNKNFDILDKIEIGVGANGYYYDFHLKFEYKENNFDYNNIYPLLTEMESIQEKIENELSEYYLLNPRNVKKLEISNFVMNIEFKNSLDLILNSKITEQFQSLAMNSEEIIPDSKNRNSFNFIINFYPEIAEEGPISLSKDIIVPERAILFSRDLSRPKKYIYYIRMRGLPAKTCLNFLKLIESIVS